MARLGKKSQQGRRRSRVRTKECVCVAAVYDSESKAKYIFAAASTFRQTQPQLRQGCQLWPIQPLKKGTYSPWSLSDFDIESQTSNVFFKIVTCGAGASQYNYRSIVQSIGLITTLLLCDVNQSMIRLL